MLSHLTGTGFTIAQLVVFLVGIGLIYGIYKISAFIHDEVTSPMRDVPGPPNPSFFYGIYKEISVSVSLKAHTVTIIALSTRMPSKKDDSKSQERWLNQYGPTIQLKGMLSVS